MTKRRKQPARKSRPVRKPVSKTRQFERALADLESTGRYVLRLYVSGTTPRSQRAIQNIKRLCETRLKDRYDLEIIDVYQAPGLVKADQVIAAPTLIKRLPLPVRRLIGDLSQEENILLGLDLQKR